MQPIITSPIFFLMTKKRNSIPFSELHLTAKNYVPDGKGGYMPAPNDHPRVRKAATPAVVKSPPAKGKWSHIRKRRGQMNKTEAMYADYLDALKGSGHILQWWYEAITIKIAADTRYVPDFLVQLPGGELVLHEVKGAQIMFTPDAKVKVKVCAAMLPFRIFIVIPKAQKRGGGYEITEVSNDE